MPGLKHLYAHYYEVAVGGEAIVAALPIKRETVINDIIRRRYTVSDEIALLANGRDSDRHAEEMDEYQTFRTAVKADLSSLSAEIEKVNAAFEAERKEREQELKNV